MRKMVMGRVSLQASKNEGVMWWCTFYHYVHKFKILLDDANFAYGDVTQPSLYLVLLSHIAHLTRQNAVLYEND